MTLEELAVWALTSQRLAGGCDDCDAYQTFRHHRGIYRITVHHDDTCPFLRRLPQR